jgi:hypothetical protein
MSFRQRFASFYEDFIRPTEKIEIDLEHLTEIIDRLEDQLRWYLQTLEDGIADKASARKVLLAGADSARDRKIIEILIRQEPSSQGKRSGNRASIATMHRDNQLLEAFKAWQAGGTNDPENYSQFARWWLKREAKDTTEPNIRRVTKRLRDARQRSSRVEHQSVD